MKVLLDTHILLWAIADSDTNENCLSQRAKEIILNPQNTIMYSSINIFEVEFKRIVKPLEELPTGEELIEYCKAAGFMELPLNSEHALVMKTLRKGEKAKDHKDPYDWLLVSQAKLEGAYLLTTDSKLKQYNENCIVSV